MPKFTVMFARFPYLGNEHPDVADWLIETVAKAKADKRIDKVMSMRYDDTPITMTRNKSIEDARRMGADILVIVDSDMKPDAYLPSNTNRIGVDAKAKPFFDTALEFMLNHQGPCLIGAPYGGPPPFENVYIFQWADRESDTPNIRWRLEQVTREEAAKWSGFQCVHALPTGLMMLDMRIFQDENFKPPYFDYEYEDKPFNTTKATTEDVYFTRNASLAGYKNYVAWDCWAGHWKRKPVGKPCLVTGDMVIERYRKAIVEAGKNTDRLIEIRPDPEMERHIAEQAAKNGHTNGTNGKHKARRLAGVK